jgi:hypothetical protein
MSNLASRATSATAQREVSTFARSQKGGAPDAGAVARLPAGRPPARRSRWCAARRSRASRSSHLALRTRSRGSTLNLLGTRTITAAHLTITGAAFASRKVPARRCSPEALPNATRRASGPTTKARAIPYRDGDCACLGDCADHAPVARVLGSIPSTPIGRMPTLTRCRRGQRCGTRARLTRENTVA